MVRKRVFILIFSLTVLLLTQCSKAPEKPDFKAIANLKERKQAFINYLVPFIHHTQIRIFNQRQQLLKINADAIRGDVLTKAQIDLLEKLAQEYNVSFNRRQPSYSIFLLLRRINTIPTAMVLAQAALESGWGTSRFAVKGNNYFGQHCFTKGCGMVPRKRASGASDEVQVFDSPQASVDAYFYLLNTGERFKKFRQMRANILRKNNRLSGKQLVSTLVHYSELDHGEYEKRLLLTMSHNNLYQYN